MGYLNTILDKALKIVLDSDRVSAIEVFAIITIIIIKLLLAQTSVIFLSNIQSCPESLFYIFPSTPKHRPALLLQDQSPQCPTFNPECALFI